MNRIVKRTRLGERNKRTKRDDIRALSIINTRLLYTNVPNITPLPWRAASSDDRCWPTTTVTRNEAKNDTGTNMVLRSSRRRGRRTPIDLSTVLSWREDGTPNESKNAFPVRKVQPNVWRTVRLGTGGLIYSRAFVCIFLEVPPQNNIAVRVFTRVKRIRRRR